MKHLFKFKNNLKMTLDYFQNALDQYHVKFSLGLHILHAHPYKLASAASDSIHVSMETGTAGRLYLELYRQGG